MITQEWIEERIKKVIDQKNFYEAFDFAEANAVIEADKEVDL